MAWMFVYLGRDVLVRVFYALGDGITPFRVSIFLNGACLCFVQIFGAPFSSGNRSEFGLDAFVILAAGSQA